ncbi:MAG: PAS domain S-box protein, partial [Candidatus Acetothermia bacterium]
IGTETYRNPHYLPSKKLPGKDQKGVELQSRIEKLKEKKSLENRLFENTRFFSSLLDNIPGVAYRCKNDSKWTVEYLSDGVEELTGYAREDFLQEGSISYADLILSEDREKVRRQVEASLNKGEPFLLTYRIQTADGDLKWIWERGRGVSRGRNASTPKRLEGVILDITERKLVQLRSKYLYSLLESISGINQLIVREEDLDQLLKKSCSMLKENRGYLDIEIGIVKDDATSILPVAHQGSCQSRNWKISPNGAGQAPRCIREVVETGAEKIIKDPKSYCKSCNFCNHETTHKSIIVPLTEDGTVVGTLLICRDQSSELYEEEMRLLRGVADDLTHARRKILTERKASKQTQAMNSSRDGMAILNDKENFIYLNQAHADIYGYSSPEELLGKPWKVLYEEAELRRFKEKIMPQLRQKGSWRGEATGTKEDGSKFPQEVSLTKLDEGGLICVVRDITDRKERERKLQELNKFRETIIESTNVWLDVLDEDGNVVIWNKAAQQISGYSTEEVEGHDRIWEWLYPDPDYRKKVLEQASSILKGEQVLEHYETEITTKSGESRIISWHSKVVRDENGDLMGSVAVGRDVTERKKAQEKLEESERKYRSIFETTGTAMMIIEEDTTISMANEEAASLSGYSVEEIEGKLSWKEIVARDEDLEKMMKYHQLRREDPEAAPNQYEFKFKNRRGEENDVWVTIDMIPGSTQSVASMADITERKEQKQALEEAFIDLAETTSRVLGVRDPYTKEHEQRVAQLAQEVGRRLGLSDDQLLGLYLGGLLHDIGKIAIPETIMTKPGELSDLEWQLIKSHPEVGYEQILKDTNFPWPVAEMTLHHHERLDGSGYPDGLQNEELSLEVRIIGAVDVVEAMSSQRPYRSAKAREEVLREIEIHKGTKYDPDVVDILLDMIAEGQVEFD